MNLKSKALLLLSPVIIIPILMIGAVSAEKLRLATEARLNTGITTLLDQISRQGFDAAFNAKDEVLRRDITLDLPGLENIVNTHVIGETGYLLVIDASGEILYSPKTIPLSSVENNLRLLGEKIITEDNNIRTEINVDGNLVFSYRKELASGMNVIAFLPEVDVTHASYELSKNVFVMTFVVALFVLISVLMSLRYLIMKPLDSLNSAIHEVRDGDLDVDIDFARNDEIGMLSKSFSNMRKDLKKTYEEVHYIANHDSLTGLPNRSMFSDYLEKIMAISNIKKHKLALLFIDLDNFKQINDTYGHLGGDILLKEMALRLNNSLRKNKTRDDDLHDKSCDMVSRIGGDEFIVLLDEIDGPWDATTVSDRILKLLVKPVVINDEDVYISCSIGAAIYPDDALTTQELIKNADIAMNHAKGRGKNHYQFYSDEINTIMHNRLKIHSRLRGALDDNQFFMHYQPKFDSFSGAIVGLEALIRWQHPEDGLISPEVFVPIAEESGLIAEITNWVMHTVCGQGMDWFNSGRLTMPIAVNISGIQFKRFDLLTMITACLEDTEFPPEMLEIELTETSLLSETEHAIEIFTSLRELGVSIALDDFGTGYSSLSYLNQLPINTLKIDSSFVNEIKSHDDEGVIDAIIALGHALDLSIVAEGVETEIQRDYLKLKECDVMQGFLLSRPLSVDDMTIKLDEALLADL